MSERVRLSSANIRHGRLRKASEFLDAGLVLDDEMADAAIALFVNAGIAAADLTCGARLGKHSASDSHNAATTLLAKAEPGMEKHLRTLLNVKSKVAYTHHPASREEHKKSRRAAELLVEAARRAAASAGTG